MRLLSVLALAVAVGGSAFGADLFTCKVKEGSEWVTVKFGVRNLTDAKHISLIQLPGSEESSPIQVKPTWLKGHKQMAQMNTLNDQGGDIRLTADTLKLFGDGDGEEYVYLVLYKNSGYTRGYVRVSGSVSWYQNIGCTRSKI